MTGTPPWRPSRSEQRLLWYLDLLLKFGVGGGGIVWEFTVDRLHNPLALVVCGLLASSLNVREYVKRLVAAARADEDEFKRLLAQEERLDRERHADDQD
jgi:hypothetical protein